MLLASGIGACITAPIPTASLATATVDVAGSPGSCPVTVGQPGTAPPASVPDPSSLPVPWVDTWFGNTAIWIRLPIHGVLPAMPDPGKTTISTKFPWWRVLSGQLTVSGNEVSGAGGQLEADVGKESEYGPTGFVPSGLTFGGPGCWSITGSVQGQTLSFIASVVVQSPEPTT